MATNRKPLVYRDFETQAPDSESEDSPSQDFITQTYSWFINRDFSLTITITEARKLPVLKCAGNIGISFKGVILHPFEEQSRNTTF